MALRLDEFTVGKVLGPRISSSSELKLQGCASVGEVTQVRVCVRGCTGASPVYDSYVCARCMVMIWKNGT